MYTLYWSEGTASLAPRIVLEETGADYEVITIDTGKSEHRTPEYLSINPFGKVPAMALPDGQIMTEAAAICLYLIEQHDLNHLAPPPKTPQRAEFLKWIVYLTNTIQENYKRYYHSERFLPKGGDTSAIREVGIKDLIEFWRPVEISLQSSKGTFMLGKNISLLDIYITMLVTWFNPMEELLERYPALKLCFNASNQHSSVEKAMKTETSINLKAADADSAKS